MLKLFEWKFWHQVHFITQPVCFTYAMISIIQNFDIATGSTIISLFYLLLVILFSTINFYSIYRNYEEYGLHTIKTSKNKKVVPLKKREDTLKDEDA